MAENKKTTIGNKTASITIHREGPTVIIGERINPTGRKSLIAALKDNNFEMVRSDAVAQVNAGAAVLDVNAGVPGTDEPALLVRVIKEVMAVTETPLCIDTANPQALEAALRLYEGKALINSTNAEEKSLASVLPLAREFGAAVIGLCMDEDGIPATPEKRLAAAGRIIERATAAGIPIEDIIIDPLAMSLGADHRAGITALETIKLIVNEFGVNITIGASNISFGVPDRELLNAAFIAMAISAGLTCPIANPLAGGIRTAVLAADLAAGKDEYAAGWIKDYRKRRKTGDN